MALNAATFPPGRTPVERRSPGPATRRPATTPFPPPTRPQTADSRIRDGQIAIAVEVSRLGLQGLQIQTDGLFHFALRGEAAAPGCAKPCIARGRFPGPVEIARSLLASCLAHRGPHQIVVRFGIEPLVGDGQAVVLDSFVQLSMLIIVQPKVVVSLRIAQIDCDRLYGVSIASSVLPASPTATKLL